MTAAGHRRLVELGEYQAQRDLAQEVGCQDCKALIGAPCTNPYGGVLPMEHPRRITKAKRLRELGVAECSFCQRVRLTPEQREATPWPAELIWCGWHRRVAEEIDEAKEMERS